MCHLREWPQTDVPRFGVGGNAQSTVTFDNVVVPATGTYQMEIDYMTQGQRSFFITVNGNATQELDLNGYSYGTPTSTTIQVPLHAGSNQIKFSNPSNYAPNLDSIAISPPTVF
ncbi:MAG TPA: CBM35 domain-containing protein [Candidatus Sulfotelmatobacter sp.]|jgi:alpha-galactosidase|nr:CBM35 domain-containing protein [Candidatus Sulfotelmatobacter sp.]